MVQLGRVKVWVQPGLVCGVWVQFGFVCGSAWVRVSLGRFGFSLG